MNCEAIGVAIKSLFTHQIEIGTKYGRYDFTDFLIFGPDDNPNVSLKIKFSRCSPAYLILPITLQINTFYPEFHLHSKLRTSSYILLPSLPSLPKNKQKTTISLIT